MKQPMSKREIEVWDAIAGKFIGGFFDAQQAYSMALCAIDARRAALIADAHVGEPCEMAGSWTCRCEENDMQVDNYCEACHTRRPDEVKP